MLSDENTDEMYKSIAAQHDIFRIIRIIGWVLFVYVVIHYGFTAFTVLFGAGITWFSAWLAMKREFTCIIFQKMPSNPNILFLGIGTSTKPEVRQCENSKLDKIQLQMKQRIMRWIHSYRK